MKSLKKLITMLLALAMILTSVGITSLASFSDINDGQVADAVDKLVAGGIITGYEDGTFRPDNQITRAEFAAIVTRYKGIADNLASDAVTGFKDLDADSSRAWARPYVKAAVDAKIINGFDDGTFRAGEPVTYEQAVKMLVCAAGYEVVAQSEYNKIIITNPNATWSAGYIAAGNKHGITKGVITAQISEPALRGVVAVLTSNTIDLPALNLNDDGSYVKDETQNSNDQNLVQVTGSVTGTYYTGLETDHVGIGPDEIIIKTSKGEEKYQLAEKLVENFDLEDYIGKYVLAYYDKLERKITSISQRNTTSIVINEQDVIRPISGGELKYYDSKGSRQSVDLSAYTWIYNGKYVTAGSIDLQTNFKNGKIELVESAGNKVAKITSYEVFVVNGYTKSTGKVTFKYGKTYEGQEYYQFPSSTDAKPVIYVNGAKKSFDSLSLPSYSVINYMESPASAAGNKLKKMYVTTGAKSGKVTASYDDSRKVELNDTVFYLTNDYANYAGSDKAPFELGDNYRNYYLDYTGQIAAVNYNAAESSSYQVGYIIDADRNQVKILQKDGKIISFDMKDSVKIDGTPTTKTSVRAALVSVADTINSKYNAIFTGSVVSDSPAQPVKYLLSSNRIDSIDTINTNPNGTGGNDDSFSHDAPLTGTSKPSTTTVVIGGVAYDIDGDTLIIYIPEDRTIEAEYNIMTASKAFAVPNVDRHVEVFGSTGSTNIKTAGVILIYGNDPTINFTGGSPYMIVTGKSYSGDDVVIRGYKQGNSEPGQITVNTEKFKVDTDLSAMSVSYSDVNVGDFIRYTGSDSAVTRIELLYDADDASKNLNTPNQLAFSSGGDSSFYIKYGKVIKNENDGQLQITQELVSEALDDIIAKRLIYNVSGSVVYNTQGEEIVTSTGISAAIVGSRVITITTYERDDTPVLVYVVQ